jgi:hypothetical protein
MYQVEVWGGEVIRKIVCTNKVASSIKMGFLISFKLKSPFPTEPAAKGSEKDNSIPQS